MKVHIFMTIIAIFFSYILHISFIEWVLMLICIGIVISLEMLNTALEIGSNMICLEHNENIKNIKDIGAGAVLVMAIVSALVAGIIFIPKIIQIF